MSDGNVRIREVIVLKEGEFKREIYKMTSEDYNFRRRRTFVGLNFLIN